LAGGEGGFFGFSPAQRPVAQIKPQFGFARLFIRAMALEAVVRKDWPHIAVELDFVRAIDARDQHKEQPQKRKTQKE
jgi:hypothetical protein